MAVITPAVRKFKSMDKTHATNLVSIMFTSNKFMSATSIHFPPANSHQRCQDSGTQKAGGVSGDKFASSSLVYSEVKRILLISRLPILKLMNSFGEDGFKPWELFFLPKKSSPKCFMTIGFTWVSVARFLLTMAWFILQVHELSGWCQLVSGRPYSKKNSLNCEVLW